eukprot:Anaeramoba_flamelloidesa809332_561.p1 GENE.a809332_561~~a809332_561.p1  ORF type:complete len:641 (+),score=158.77 a809332_561:35-1924(+)
MEKENEFAKYLKTNKEQLDNVIVRRFFYTQTAEIYGGTKGLFDLGPPGCALKQSILKLWRQHFTIQEGMLEVESTMLTPSIVFDSSGHTKRFHDFVVQDLETNECSRADHILEDWMEKLIEEKPKNKEEYQLVKIKADSYTKEEIDELFEKYQITTKSGNKFSKAKPFNLMFGTQIGPLGSSKGFLRPETAQGIFVNFKRLLEYNGGKLPFACSQIGTSFRNEISPRQGLIRVREFPMAEIEHFVDPLDKSCKKFEILKDLEISLFPKGRQENNEGCIVMKLGEAVEKKMINNETLAYYMGRTYLFLKKVGLKEEGLRFRQHLDNEMAHYAQDCWDAEALTSYGWVEIAGHADRAAYDLSAHMKHSKQDMRVFIGYDVPRVEEVLVFKPKMPAFGKHFKRDTRFLMDYLKSESAESIIQLINEELFIKNKESYTLKVDEEKCFQITPDLIQIVKTKKKKTGRRFVPSVIEPSFGIGRIMYCVLEHSFYVRQDEELKNVFQFTPFVAPVKCCVLPISMREEFEPSINKVAYALGSAGISRKIDVSGATIGKRYARTDEIGIPFTVTIDFQTIEDGSVTLRERDSTKQVRGTLKEIVYAIQMLLKGKKDGGFEWEDVLSKYTQVKRPEKEK